jgi:hypothetical protein
MSNTPLVIEQQAMKEHFIAIRYVHGSGGHFLNAWLTASKLNLTSLPLGEYGSGHYAYKEFNLYKGPAELPKPAVNITTYPPYFVYTEYRSLIALSSIFHKIINISYEVDDCDEIELCFLGKFYLEQDSKNSTYCRHHLHRQKDYAPIESTEDILNITWKELLHGDAITLCERLSTFTGISDIKIDYLREWREKTKLGMDKTRTQIIKNKDLVEL